MRISIRCILRLGELSLVPASLVSFCLSSIFQFSEKFFRRLSLLLGDEVASSSPTLIALRGQAQTLLLAAGSSMVVLTPRLLTSWSSSFVSGSSMPP
uniref:Putative secreted protein n=1 Tax=Panstrongylus lignarius TaxID=156445 RepID=A0A224Y2U4_9HEMI